MTVPSSEPSLDPLDPSEPPWGSVSAVPFEGAAGPVGLVGPDGEPARARVDCMLGVDRG